MHRLRNKIGWRHNADLRRDVAAGPSAGAPGGAMASGLGATLKASMKALVEPIAIALAVGGLFLLFRVAPSQLGGHVDLPVVAIRSLRATIPRAATHHIAAVGGSTNA